MLDFSEQLTRILMAAAVKAAANWTVNNIQSEEGETKAKAVTRTRSALADLPIYLTV